MPEFSNKTKLSVVREMLNETGIRKNNFEATRAPTADDVALGYEAGSRWLHNGIEYTLMDGAPPVTAPASGSYTVATLSGLAPRVGQAVFVSNGNAGQPCLAVWDGAAWRRIPLGAAVSAT